MKRFFALLLGAAMLLSFAACSSSDAAAPTDATAPTVPATTPVAEIVPPAQSPAAQDSMGETVLVDNDAVTFSVIKTEHTDHLGMQLHVQCVNKTDRTLMFSWDMVSVCGYMYDPMWAVEVAAGKTANSSIDLDTYTLEKMGVASVDEITFTLRIYDSDNWMEAPIVQEAYTIYPTGLTAETLVLPQHPGSASQVVIAEDENVRFVIEGVNAEDPAEYTLSVYMENKTNRNLMYSWDLVSVNGKMIDPFWAMSVAAGKRACSEISFFRSDLESNGITDVSDIEFTLMVSDYDNWEAGPLLEQICTYNP